MLQPYPLAVGEKLDFEFDLTELAEAADSVASYTITQSAAVTVSADSEDENVVTFWVEWEADTEVGTPGWVECSAISTAGRTVVKRMTFFASEPTT